MAAVRQKPTYVDCDGLLIAAGFSPDVCRSVFKYTPKSGDIFIDTYPKCGTTWMQHIAMLILRKGQPFTDELDFFLNCPFLEMTGADVVDCMTDRGVLKTHLPFHLTPFSSEAKYIYIARNCRDCCVSFYHHTKLFEPYNFVDGTFDDYFEVFIKGEVDWGDYFDHLLGWYQHRNEPNVYFTTYENLKRDTKEEILKVSKFIGEEYYRNLMNDSKMLENVLYYSSLEYMKENMNTMMKTYYQKLVEGCYDDMKIPSGLKILKENIKLDMALKSKSSVLSEKEDKIDFVRKGAVKDWVNYFNEDQERRLNERIAEKTAGSDVMNLWKDVL